MGHEDFATTLIYSHYSPGEREAELVERAFEARSPDEGTSEGTNLPTAGDNSDQLEATEADTHGH